MSMWEYIDKIMTHPDYDKSFNKVINSALLFGLPILYKRLFDTVEIDGEETTLELRVAPEDMGKVIGRQGRIAKEIRTIIKSVAQRKGQHVNVEIIG